MKTIGWWLKKPDENFFLALHGDIALMARSAYKDEVWQFRTPGGQQAAIARLVEETEEIERAGGRMQGDPVEFTLSPAALDEIRGYPAVIDWPTAPLLREELMQLIHACLLTAKPPPDWKPLCGTDIARIYAVPKGMIA